MNQLQKEMQDDYGITPYSMVVVRFLLVASLVVQCFLGYGLIKTNETLLTVQKQLLQVTNNLTMHMKTQAIMHKVVEVKYGGARPLKVRHRPGVMSVELPGEPARPIDTTEWEY